MALPQQNNEPGAKICFKFWEVFRAITVGRIGRMERIGRMTAACKMRAGAVGNTDFTVRGCRGEETFAAL